MAELVTLTEDGPFGKAGDQVWVNDASDVQDKPRPAAAKKAAAGRGKPEPADKG